MVTATLPGEARWIMDTAVIWLRKSKDIKQGEFDDLGWLADQPGVSIWEHVNPRDVEIHNVWSKLWAKPPSGNTFPGPENDGSGDTTMGNQSEAQNQDPGRNPGQATAPGQGTQGGEEKKELSPA